ncbi:MAG: MBL fold metallo-hydrolase [Alphaproteobacteria bacterium]
MAITPTKLFDNLYSVGQNEVSAQALVTSGGIILFDTLSSEDEARNILVPNMIALGLKPQDIKYVVISHEHGDHYGGAPYLQKTYGAKVVGVKGRMACRRCRRAGRSRVFRFRPRIL